MSTNKSICLLLNKKWQGENTTLINFSQRRQQTITEVKGFCSRQLPRDMRTFYHALGSSIFQSKGNRLIKTTNYVWICSIFYWIINSHILQMLANLASTPRNISTNLSINYTSRTADISITQLSVTLNIASSKLSCSKFYWHPTNLISTELRFDQMGGGKKKRTSSWSLTALASWVSCFGRSSVHRRSHGTRSSVMSSYSAPEAAMVAGAKHFSSAHKIRFGWNFLKMPWRSSQVCLSATLAPQYA